MSFTFVLVKTIFVIFVVSLFVWFWKRRHLYILSWKLPGPFAWPLVGNGLSMLEVERNLYYLDEICQKYSSPFRLWIGPELFIFVYDVHDTELILKSPHCLNKTENYKFAKDGIGEVDGLFTANVDMWKRNRKLIAPFFGLNVVYGHLSIFNKHSKQLSSRMQNEIKEFDIRELFNITTIDIFLDSVLGSSTLTSNDKEIYSDLFNKGQKIISKRFFQPWLQIEWIWNLTKYSKNIKEISNTCTKLINKIITLKITEGSESLTFIDKLIQTSEENTNFTIENVRAETQTLLIAASDTTSLTAAFTILMLAIHPGIQQHVFDEIYRVLPDANANITKNNVDQLTYLERCIKETLRLFPTGSIIGRLIDEPIKLKNADIPKGTSVFIGLRQLMRCPKHWGPKSNQFDPDHFLPANLVGKTPFYFVPFSEGPRNCIGEKYAMVVMKVMIAHLVRQFEFKSTLKMDDLKLSMDINIRLLNGHMVQAFRRSI